jgi:mono/diheme cytochrome c family protein
LITISKAGFVLWALAAMTAPQAALAAGEQTFSAQCSMCHQKTGAGLPGQFPRIAGRVPQIASSAGGRRYLALVLINGLYGPITVDGRAINGMMPAAGSLSDQAIADVLNHVLTLPGRAKKGAQFTAAEIAAARAVGRKSGNELAAERSRLVAAKLIL